MSKTTVVILSVVGVLLGLGVLTALWVMGTYNGMVTGDESVQQAWAQVENVYQRRQDLIPNLVETVKGYAAHERQTFQEVTEARSKATGITVSKELLQDPGQFAKFQAAQDALSSALSRLMVVVERYPDLKANENFLNLQAQLEGTENRIAVERRNYNESAQAFNVRIRRFPGNLMAALFDFRAKEYFKAEAGAEKAPQVNFTGKE